MLIGISLSCDNKQMSSTTIAHDGAPNQEPPNLQIDLPTLWFNGFTNSVHALIIIPRQTEDCLGWMITRWERGWGGTASHY